MAKKTEISYFHQPNSFKDTMKTGKILGVLCALFLLHACSDKVDPDFNSNPDLFKEFITGFTAGPVPVKSDFRVQLAFSKKEWKPETELPRSLFDISPSVKGKVLVLAGNTVAFIPSGKLDQDTPYQVKFKLSEVIEVPKELAEFRFTVKTIKQDIAVSALDLQSYSRDWQYLNGRLRSADQLDTGAAKKILDAEFAGQNVKIKLDAEKSTPTDIRFRVDSIKRGSSDGQLQVEWDGSKADIDREGKLHFPIAAVDHFKVLKIEVGDDTNQMVRINFSDRLDKDQDFSGLVSVQYASNLRFMTEGNVLKVFFDNGGPVTAAAVTDAALDTAAVAPVSQSDVSIDSRLIEVFQGIRNSEGRKMSSSFTQKINFEQIKPGIRLLKSGTVLPASANLKLNFEAANLNAVDVKIYKIYKNNIMQFLQDNQLNGARNLRQVAQPVAVKKIVLKQNNLIDYTKWNTYALDLSKLISPDPGAIYRVEFGMKRAYSMYKCTGQSSEYENAYDSEEELDEDEVNYSGYGYDDYYYEDDYDWYSEENPCSNYFFHNKVATNVLASDLGVIAKRGQDKSYFIAVNNILTTQPVAGASVKLFSFQQQEIASGQTGPLGTITFKSNKYAYFAIVTKGNQSSYLKLDDERSLSLSNFDVAGEWLEKGLKGYIYGERGVWRPGDTMYLSFILNDNANKLPDQHPIKFRLTDPRGTTVVEKVQPKNKGNHYVFEIETDASAPTGSWEAMVSVGGAHFYKNIKVETIKPNRLKIKNSFNGDFLSASQENKNTVTATWLHGAVAKGLKLDVQMKLSSQSTSFKGFDDYVFDDATRSFSSEEINLFSGNVNDAGQATYTIAPNLHTQAPGMLRAAFISKVYETGGDVSTDVSAADYSPYPTYLGLKTAGTNRYGMLETGKPNQFAIVSVDEKGNAKGNVPVDVKVYRLESRWWWDASADNLSRYSSATSITPYKEFSTQTNSSGRASVALTVPNAEWGRFLVRVIDKNNGHATSQTIYIDWPSWSGRTRETDGESASMLMFSTDKKKYETGEKARIFFPSSAGGRALISLENGTKVIKTFWAETKAGETQVSVPVTGDMAPNVYVHITLLQPHANTKNDSPIRMYGVVPIEVVDKKTILEPVATLPSELRPNQTFNLKVAEKTGRAMTYTIAIVDEGLLDLTRFQTPNAWDAFYVREALGVRTWDLYDDVIGAYGGKISQVFAIGGDAALGGGKAKKANRFKPVVKFLGPFQVGAGQAKNHKITLPNYVGSVRAMVVAADAASGAYGKVEKTVPVKSPLMVLASLPRKITPSEKVVLPVTVFAMKNTVKNVSVEVKTSPNIKVVGSAKQSLTFASPDEKMAYFNLMVTQATGIGKVSVITRSGKEVSKYEVEIDVLNPNPVTHTFQDIVLGPNQTQSISWDAFGENGTAKASVEVSSFPTIDLNRRLDYLIQYPHGCVEQTTSSVFPQLYLADIMDVEPARKQQMQRYVSAAIQRLGSFQQAGGGLTYWPGGSYSDDWGSTYAGHFMIEAEKKGYVLPIGFKQKWISYQRKQAGNWRLNRDYGNDQAQAYRLYTLALAGSPDLPSMNRLRETAAISNEAKLRLAAAYALAKQPDAARALLSKSTLESYEPHYFYYGSPERNRAMELETLLLLGQQKQAFPVAAKLAKELSSQRWMSTQTTAFGLYAMAKFALINGKDGIQLDMTQGGKKVELNTKKSMVSRNLSVVSGKNGISLKNNKKNTVYVRVLNSGILPVGKELAEQRNLKVSSVFRDAKGEAINVSKIRQGTEFTAEILVTNTSNEYLTNVALTQILPSGFEIVNTRYTNYGAATQNNADYIDIRDDRANYYFWIKPGETRKFSMKLNASYPGIYYMPGVQCEAMYDNNFLARNKGQWVEVLR